MFLCQRSARVCGSARKIKLSRLDGVMLICLEFWPSRTTALRVGEKRCHGASRASSASPPLCWGTHHVPWSPHHLCFSLTDRQDRLGCASLPKGFESASRRLATAALPIRPFDSAPRCMKSSSPLTASARRMYFGFCLEHASFKEPPDLTCVEEKAFS